MSEITFPESQVDFQSAWSRVGGELSGLKWAHSMLLADAGFYFTQGNDEQAKLMRDTAKRIQKHIDDVSKVRDAYIKEGDRRRDSAPSCKRAEKGDSRA